MTDRDKELLRHTPLDDAQFELMTEVERVAEELEALSLRLQSAPSTDKRWAATGTTDIQKGVMCWRPSIGQPRKF